jgi:hypothetical protein
MIRSIWIYFLTCAVFLILISSCATVPTEPLAPGELRLLSLEVEGAGSVRGDTLIQVKVTFEAEGRPELRKACFYWSEKGPYCTQIKDVSWGSPSLFVTWIRSGRTGIYNLEGYIEYIRDGKPRVSNRVSTNVSVAN